MKESIVQVRKDSIKQQIDDLKETAEGIRRRIRFVKNKISTLEKYLEEDKENGLF